MVLEDASEAEYLLWPHHDSHARFLAKSQPGIIFCYFTLYNITFSHVLWESFTNAFIFV